MIHRLLLSFFQGKYLVILGLMVISLLSLGLTQSFAQTTITLDTSKNSYEPGDLVEVKGQVADSPNNLVAVEVKDPNGNTIMIRTVKTDGTGIFLLKFKLSSTAKAGNYNIIANTNIDGNSIQETKEISTTTTVPEFSSTTPLVLVASIVSILALSAKIRPNLKI